MKMYTKLYVLHIQFSLAALQMILALAFYFKFFFKKSCCFSVVFLSGCSETVLILNEFKELNLDSRVGAP